MKMTKILRPLMKCPKCGHRKRVDLKYCVNETFEVGLGNPLVVLDAISFVCAVCSYELIRTLTVQQAQTTGKDINEEAKKATTRIR